MITQALATTPDDTILSIIRNAGAMCTDLSLTFDKEFVKNFKQEIGIDDEIPYHEDLVVN